MNLADVITVNTNYTRSINLERDVDSVSLVKSYIPTSRSVYALQKAVDTLKTEADMPRAWTLVGPYGSGKSSFAVFLSHLLANPNNPASKAALKVLGETYPVLEDQFNEVSEMTRGHCVVLITGSPEPLGKRLIQAVSEAAIKYWQHRKEEHPEAVKIVISLAKQEQISTSEIMNAIKSLQTAIGKVEGNGLLIVIDELGKFLEYEARHPDTNDIYLLQALAELAFTGGKSALSIYVILHQAFEQYAKGLGDTLKNEWAKVQGRFESIPFLEATEQTLRVVANAIQHNTSIDSKAIKTQTDSIAKALANADALSGTLEEKEASKLFAKCYPLHPVSALLLPVLCQKVAQNERTLFNYLGSEEPFGLKQSLTTLGKVGDWIYPWEIYEYFIHNQSASLVDHFTHRRWAEVVTAVERLGDIDSNETRLLKAIGLLNIIGNQGGLKASKTITSLCLPDKNLVEEIIQSLQTESIIQYRKYNSEYRVWQGSDFDIETAIYNGVQRLGLFSIANYLNTQYETRPIIARRFSIKTGTLRFFETAFVDIDTYTNLSSESTNARIIFYLSQDQEDSRKFQSELVSYYGERDILVEFPQTELLRGAIADVLALREIQASNQELHSDPIAQREFKDRYQAALQIEETKYSEIIDHPETSHWYWKGEAFTVLNKRDLQNRLSDILDDIYKSTPVIKNELINRIKPSSQAAAGRNKLLQAMVNHPQQEDLGIDKFPAEKAMYRAVLKQTGLHVFTEKQWEFVAPTQESTLYPVWKAMESFLETTEKTPRSFAELAKVISKPPYGIKSGLLPILYLALYLVKNEEIALYEDRRYLPSLSKEELERFVKKPDGFTVQLFKIEGLNASLFQCYTDALFGKEKPASVIQAIRPLAQFINDLNEYTQKTTTIPKKAQALRSAFNLSKSPESLLFEGIPKALGYKKVDNQNLEGYADALKAAIRELKYAYENLLKKQKELLENAFHLTKNSELSELRVQLRGRYKGLEQYTVDIDGLKAFIMRLTSETDNAEKWFSNLLMFLGNKDSTKWRDTDQSRAELRLSEYSKRILDLETLNLEQKRMAMNTDQDFDVILLKAIKKGDKERVHAVAIDASTHKAAATIKEKIKIQLNLESEELQLAVLAELVDEFLQEYQTTSQQASAIQKKLELKRINNG
ncbi:MAG: Unknown protein [uncultured Thiotrichaceae bacterium]|uniref:ATP-binding protein n=1 Tax=uncultured Thiotrichaceae bacterium TaxID=298394 RepID=A0A6S6UFQ4_9GAMM|nr:MAG: Unknown protein [uncultured Thiotrichaceae bacterium]